MIINSPLLFNSIFLGIIFALKLFREEIAGQTLPIKGGGKMKKALYTFLLTAILLICSVSLSHSQRTATQITINSHGNLWPVIKVPGMSSGRQMTAQTWRW